MPDPRGKEKKLLLDKIIMEPCPIIPGTEEKSIAGGWTPVVQICTLAGTHQRSVTFHAPHLSPRSILERDAW
jgi:hypothetical protein